jgi:hypothetical protein
MPSAPEATRVGLSSCLDGSRSTAPPPPRSSCLLNEPPEQQVLGRANSLQWRPVGLGDCKTELEKVVRLLNTARNNLFHGGKHYGAGWDDPHRTFQLLTAGHSLLQELAEMAGLQLDHAQIY